MHRWLVVGILLLLWIMTGCSGHSLATQQALQATKEAEATLTAAHESEVRSLILTYHIEADSYDAWRDRSKLSKVMTGPLLKTLLSFGTPEPSSEFYVTRSVEISEIHVLEYTPTQIKAIGCGKVHKARVTYEGEYINTVQPVTLMNIYVFVYEDGIWKLFTAYNFADSKGALRDWNYVSVEEKQAIGDLANYIDMYWGCGMGQ